MTKEEANKLHDKLIKAATKKDDVDELLINSTTYNHALLPILNCIIKGVDPTKEELEFTEYMIEEYEKQNQSTY